jgi:type II secretory pathway component GspD/PulD (secretin)
MYHNKNSNNRIKNKGTLFILGFVLAVMAATTFGDVEQGPMTAGAEENINAEDVNVSSMTAGAEEDINAEDVNVSSMVAEAEEDINTKDVNPDPCGRGVVNVSSGEDIAAGGTIQSITFDKDRTIKDGLRVLSAMYKKNIVPSPKVDGVMGFTRLYNVTFEEAMDAILGVNFKYEQKGQLIKVYTEEEYKKIKEDKSRMVYKVFTLHYINAAEVKALITPLKSESGKITSTTAAVVDTEAGKGGDTASMRDTVVVYDFPERLDQIGQMIKEIDIKPQQILIEVTVLKVRLTETTEFGINWNNISGTTVTQYTNGISVGLASGITPAGAGLSVGFHRKLSQSSNDELVSLITALEDVTDWTVLANPKIMALNKQAGYINIGSETGYTESTTQTSGGNTTASVAFLPSGTLLRFRPFICDDGYVRMEINPEESTATTTTVGSTVIPSKTITQVRTNIMVKDGRTIIIGGLFKEELTNTDSQVPVFGDIPVVGAIFKRTKDANIRSELIILITPHVINEPEELASEDRENDISRIVHGSRKRISSISRVRIYEDCYAKAVEYYLKGKKKAALNELNWALAARPTYLEALRLKERIIRETAPDGAATIERIMLNVIEREESSKWLRR